MQVLSWPGEAAVTSQPAATPRLVVVDDLHRADEASLRPLAYLSETLWPVPLGMIVTYRHTEVLPASLAARGDRQPGARCGQPPV